MKEYGFNENDKLYTVENGKVELLSDYDDSIHNSICCDCKFADGPAIVHDDKYIYFLTTLRKNTALRRFDANGNLETLIDRQGSLHTLSLCGDKVYFTGMREMGLTECYCFDGKEEEKLIVQQNLEKNFPQANTILRPADIIKAREVVKDVYMDEKIEKYIIDIVFATRSPKENGLEKFKDMIAYGGSPRASISLAKASKAYAFIKRRGYVIPEDVRAVCPDVLRHRIGLTYEAEANNITSEDIVNEVLNTVEVP